MPGTTRGLLGCLLGSGFGGNGERWSVLVSGLNEVYSNILHIHIIPAPIIISGIVQKELMNAPPNSIPTASTALVFSSVSARSCRRKSNQGRPIEGNPNRSIATALSEASPAEKKNNPVQIPATSALLGVTRSFSSVFREICDGIMFIQLGRRWCSVTEK
jgi:hypothetical protein